MTTDTRRKVPAGALVVLALGIGMFLASFAPNYIYNQRILGDFLDLFGHIAALGAGAFIVHRIVGEKLVTKVFYVACAGVVIPRILDFAEELSFLSAVPVLANSPTHRLIMAVSEGIGYSGILLTFITLLYQVVRLRDKAEAEHGRYRKANEARMYLARVADMAAEAVAGFDRDGAIRSWNLGARCLFGYTCEEAVSMSITDLVVRGFDEMQPDFLAHISASGSLQEIEVVGRAKSGKEFPAEASLSFVSDEHGEPVGISVIIRDIGRRKQAEQQLIRSRNLLAGALQNADVGMFIMSQDTELIEFNRRMEEITGWKRHELDSMSLPEGVHALVEEPEAFMNRYVEEVEKGRSVEMRGLGMRHKNGERRICNVAMSPVFDESGAFAAVAGIVIDVTEREKLQGQLLEAQKLESLGRLAGGIAHDFNNILAGILGYASLLQSKLAKEHSLRHYVGAIVDSSNRAAELTHQLLAFAKGGNYQFAPVSLNDLAHETIQLLSHSITPNIKIEFHPDPQLATIEADSSQMKQMLMNLVINARDALGEKGRITVSTANVYMSKELQRQLDVPGGGPFVELRVQDNGKGMPPEVTRRIFEPFFSTKEQGEGYGLGLSVVYGIVQAHHGRVDVASEAAKGTRFTVYLPAAEGVAPAAKHVTRQSEVLEPGTETILVVDDEELIRTLANDILSTMGYAVITAASGEEAIEVYQDKGNGINLVVLDLLMPGMGGAKTLEQLRAMDSEVRCIICSGYGAETVSPSFLSDDFIRVVAKPFNAHVFTSAVRELLDT
ncbi:MAG: PAS domain S-box protein [Candidatus Hydrogenedentes bacterium]|nr:PAS domain S-box protein [Candidatus Hydrogenedentota bacterium]